MDVKITRHVTITYDGTEEQYVANAERIHYDTHMSPLDSRDAGDATGALLELLDMGHDVDDTILFEDGTTMRFSCYEDNFVYEGDWA